jgi:hypothetical protein
MISYLAISCLAYVWVVSLPTQTLRELAGITLENTLNSKFMFWLHYLCNCSLCSGTWMALIYTENLALACMIGVMAEVIHRVFSKIL